ncbi:glycosyltransferase [Pseudogemmobacter sonorensis]|uniref:glycosyltransferase n=1 Tax=Pseudogemmobacter sonorensis TaxID=2989681 RepID=UPI0036C2F881
MISAAKTGSAPAIFASVDSAPGTFAAPVPPERALRLLLLFSALSAIQILLLYHGPLARVFPAGDYILPLGFEGSHAIGLRMFSVTFLLCFALFWGRDMPTRLRLAADFLPAYAVFCLGLDLALALFSRATGMGVPLLLVEVLSGLSGWAWFALKLLQHATLPREIAVRRKATGFARDLSLATGLLILAIALAQLVENGAAPAVAALRQSGLLGGIGPGVFLVLPFFFTLLYGWARISRLQRPRDPGFAPDVTVIIPAFNEEYIIARTIRALDAAAEGYRGRVIALLIDNNSRDRTAGIARECFAACRSLSGQVLREATPGKAHALNLGLRRAETGFLVRVDADTQIMPGSIARAMSWFADPRTGVVGGLPLVPLTGPFDRARQIETLVKHGFYSVALEAVNGVVGVPGMLAVYRADLVRDLGGFVSGMNGEDTDISMRIGELGRRIVVDPRIRYISEVPASLAHMREQRLRWFRSVLHISSRCRQIVLSGPSSMRGRVILPYMLFNSARRTAMVPLLLFGLLEYFLGSGSRALMEWQPLIAVLLGASFLMTILIVLAAGAPGRLLGLPDYVAFRVLRAYFTLESMLTIRVEAKRRPFALARRR